MAGELMTTTEFGKLSEAERKRLVEIEGYTIVKGTKGPWRPESDVQGREAAIDNYGMVEMSKIVVAKRDNKGLVLRRATGTDHGVSFPVMTKTRKEVVIRKGTKGRMTAQSQYAAQLQVGNKPPVHVVRKHYDVLRQEWRSLRHWWGPTKGKAAAVGKPRLSR